MSWAALSPRLASPFLTEMGHAASFARPEAPTVTSATGPISRRAEVTPSIRIVPARSSTHDGAAANNVIVLDEGKRFFVLSVAPDTITTEEGEKLEADNKHESED